MESPTDRKAFELGYWIALHKDSLRKAYLVVWIVIVSLIWLQLGGRVLNWLTHIQQTNDIWRSISQDPVDWTKRLAPIDIETQRISTVRYDDTSVDVLVELYNPNSIWFATSVPYTLAVNGVNVEEGALAIAPLQQRYIARFRIPNSSDQLPSVRFGTRNVTWKKMADAAKILPTQSWDFANAAFHEISGDAAKAFRTEFSFGLTNNSVYGFRQVKAVLAMQDAEGNITALNSVVIDTILTKETRPVVLRWPSDISRLNTPKLYIDLDLFDPRLTITTLQ